jgi:membrane-associated phospholipid phosphatase
MAGAFIMLAVTIFALLAVALLRNQLERLDVAGAALVDTLRSPASDVFFTGITWAGSSLLLVPLCMVVAWWFRAHGRLLVAPILVAPAAAVLLQNILKPLFGRTRPEAGVLAELGPSFPSGHSMASTAVWLSLCYVLARENVLPKFALLLAPLLPLVVGISRVYLGVHWTSDVIAGWSTGLMIVVASVLLYERARPMESSPEVGRSA